MLSLVVEPERVENDYGTSWCPMAEVIEAR